MNLFIFFLLQAVSAAATTTQRAYVATSVDENGYVTNSTFQQHSIPTVGDLRTMYTGLPIQACELLIKIAASSINPSDIHPKVAPQLLPHVMGSDVAGKVMQVEQDTGKKCRFSVGDLVYGDIGANTFTSNNIKTKELGAYAEYAVVLDTQVALIPSNVNFLEAASLPKVSLTSIKALAWYGGARNRTFINSTVLILGGSGGTGTTGIQLAKYFGASNIVTTTSFTNSKYCQSLGATKIIDYHTTNWWDVLSESTFDLVYDTVGQQNTGNRAMKVLKKGGYYVTITGQLATEVKPGVVQSMFINSDTNLNSAKLMDELAAITKMNKLRMTRLSKPYTLENIQNGFRSSEGGHTVGKIVVTTDKQD